MRVSSLKNVSNEKHQIEIRHCMVLHLCHRKIYPTRLWNEIFTRITIGNISTSSSLPLCRKAVSDQAIISYSALIFELLVLPVEMHAF